MIRPENDDYPRRRRRTSLATRRGLTLVELLIIVASLGIAAGVTVPRFRAPARDAREAALLFHLTEIRTAVRRFQAQHDRQALGLYAVQLTVGTDRRGVPGSECGPYLPYGFPRNPVNGSALVKEVVTMPDSPDDSTGWLLVIPTGEVRANVRGLAPSGKDYFDL